MEQGVDSEKQIQNSMEYDNQISEKQIQISWDYAKQLNDIHCRLYLQFFVVFLTIGITVMIAVIVEKINVAFGIITVICIVLAFYYIIKLRSLPDELKEFMEDVIDKLENLK